MSARRILDRRLIARAVPPLVLGVVLLALWVLAVDREWISDLILPGPWEVVEAVWELITGDVLWENFWATTWETSAGFVLGSALGILLAVVSALSGVIRDMVYPFAVALQVTPRIAIAPILVAWLGFGYTPKIVLAATIVFFPVFLNAFTGLMAADREALEMFRSMGASRLQTFRHLRLPAALPVTFAGLKIGVTLALIGAVVGEFVTADQGLGLLIQEYSYQAEMGLAFGVIVMLTVMGFGLYGLVEYFDWALVFWTRDSRMTGRTRRRQRRDRGPDNASSGKGSTLRSPPDRVLQSNEEEMLR